MRQHFVRWQNHIEKTNSPRVIGMLGGMSWESSAQYYRLANELVRERLGGLHSARVLLASVDFADIEALQADGRWDEAGELLAVAARGLEAGGAELLVICTNTMHKVADQVARQGVDTGGVKLVVVTWDGGSNRQPFEVVCGALAGRGDTLDVLSHRSHQGLYEALGAAFHGLTVGDTPPGKRRSESEEWARVSEIWLSPVVADDTAAVVASASPDVAVVDVSMLTAAAACEAVGVPVVVMQHSLPGATWLGPRRGRFEAFVAPVNDVRAGLGLGRVGSFAELMSRSLMHVVPTAAELDAPVPWDVSLRYVGPLQPPGDKSSVPALPDRFILVSFSTTWQRHVEALQRVVDALSGFDRPVVVTTGPMVDPSEIAAPPNAIVFAELPHRKILDRADVVVTHAGHGTVLSALTAGVPLVCLPLGRDQHDVAGRVVAVGAGLTVDVEDLGAIRAGVRVVLDDAAYAARAADLGRAIANYRGVPEVLEILDSAAS